MPVEKRKKRLELENKVECMNIKKHGERVCSRRDLTGLA